MSHLVTTAKSAALRLAVWVHLVPATEYRPPSPDTPRKHNLPRTDAFSLMPAGTGSTCCARHPGLDYDSSEEDEDGSMDKTSMGDKKLDDKDE